MIRSVLKYSAAACLLVTFSACSAASEDSPTDEIVGADRDTHGCIGSAGYQWSELREDCIRIWEVGTELTHQGSGDPNFSAFAITGEDEAELFLPEEPDSIMLTRDMGTGSLVSWTDATSEYRLTYDPLAAMILTDQNGFVMYRDMSSEPLFDEIPEHAQDELGGDLVMETGLITRVEDGAYPMFTLHFRNDDDNAATLLSFNAEAATVTGASVYDLTGETVTVEYVDRDVWDLIHIQPVDAESMEDMEIGEGWRFVTGRLFGADRVSNGDLPDMLTIQMMGNESVEFELYIDPEMVALNETDVTAWLAPRNLKDVFSITVQP